MTFHARFAAIFVAAGIASGTAFAATPAEILSANQDAMGGVAWEQPALKSRYSYAGQGLTGTAEEIDDLKTGRSLSTYEIGPIKGANGYDGKEAWEKEPSGAVTLQTGGDQRETAINQAYRTANLWWRADFGGAAVESLGQRTDDSGSFDGIQVTPRGGRKFEAWFDTGTHLLRWLQEQKDARPLKISFSDYRKIQGALMPGKIVSSNGDPKYDDTQTLVSAEFVPVPADAAFAPPKAVLADASFEGGVKRTTFPFQLINNHIYADVRVNGKGPYTFIFDTGGVNLLTPATAGELGLKSEGAFQANGAGEGHMEAGFTKVQTLQLGEAIIKDQNFFVIPLDQLSKTSGVPMPGMVGFETFRRFVTRIDYGRREMTLIDPAAFNGKDSGVAIPIRFNGNTIEVQARFNGIEGNFTVDTGNRGSVDLTGVFVAKHDLRAKAGKGIEGVTGWGVGGPTRSFTTRNGTLEIGGIVIKNPVIDLSTDKGGDMANGAQAGNIGGAILKRFVVTLDYGHSIMYLEPVKGPIADLDTFDRAGMWFNDAADGFTVVDVTATGPAEQAGFVKGDFITAVNGKPVKSIHLYDLRVTLRNAKPGTVERFTVQREGKTMQLKVTLRDLI